MASKLEVSRQGRANDRKRWLETVARARAGRSAGAAAAGMFLSDYTFTIPVLGGQAPWAIALLPLAWAFRAGTPQAGKGILGQLVDAMEGAGLGALYSIGESKKDAIASLTD